MVHVEWLMGDGLRVCPQMVQMNADKEGDWLRR
jgi:hypothetical protein